MTSEDNSGDATVCSSPGSSAAWKLQWATHFSNKLAFNTAWNYTLTAHIVITQLGIATAFIDSLKRSCTCSLSENLISIHLIPHLSYQQFRAAEADRGGCWGQRQY